MSPENQSPAVVQRFGDTTDPAPNRRPRPHCGVTARLVLNAEVQLIEQQIARGIPIPCGYLHQGPVDRPTGLGHGLIGGS